MRILKSQSLLKLINHYIVDASQPANISYLWNFGSLLAVCLIIQIISGVTLAMHYTPTIMEAFNTIEHIMRDVYNGWLIRYMHSNTASAFFFLVYLHIGRGIYYTSYKLPRTIVWVLGDIIFIAMVGTGFLGYVLPYGQMSLWRATVITNLISAIPWIGQDIVEFIWGGFSVNNATLNRFFALHFLLPFILAALILMHLISLHKTFGSSNHLGVSVNYDRITFSPYYIFKDLITIFIFMFFLGLLILFVPNLLGDSENYVMANPMQTPISIVPEWYLLSFYAILRSISDKLIGVIAMFSAILAILILPITDLTKIKGLQFKPFNKLYFWIFVVNFLALMNLGACHVEPPYIELGQISTISYFSYFLIIIIIISLLENYNINTSLKKKSSSIYNYVLTTINIPKGIRQFHATAKNLEKKLYYHGERAFVMIGKTKFPLAPHNAPWAYWGYDKKNEAWVYDNYSNFFKYDEVKEKWVMNNVINPRITQRPIATYMDIREGEVLKDAQLRLDIEYFEAKYCKEYLPKEGINPYTGKHFSEEPVSKHCEMCICPHCSNKRNNGGGTGTTTGGSSSQASSSNTTSHKKIIMVSTISLILISILGIMIWTFPVSYFLIPKFIIPWGLIA